MLRFVVTKGHNIVEVTESIFTAVGNHNCLWSEATRLIKSQFPVVSGTNGHVTYSNNTDDNFGGKSARF